MKTRSAQIIALLGLIVGLQSYPALAAELRGGLYVGPEEDAARQALLQLLQSVDLNRSLRWLAAHEADARKVTDRNMSARQDRELEHDSGKNLPSKSGVASDQGLTEQEFIQVPGLIWVPKHDVRN